MNKDIKIMEATAVMDGNAEEDTQEPEKAYFTALEARVIASLMEKHLTTPNNYPLTMNSLTNACNQKSNREPVMNLTEGQIGHTVNQLVERKLVGLEHGERANKITHRICTELDLNRQQQAILTVLMLRKPQTLNDIKTRTTRMADFSELEVQDVMNSLIEREKPLAVLIPKGAGRREDRFSHTLCGEIEIATSADNKPTMIDAGAIENERMDALEARISAIEEKLGLKIEL
jgi:hypothetical protein